MTKRYIIEGPDGKRYIVEGPSEGAAPPQAGQGTPAPVQTPPEGSEPFVRAGGYGPVLAGVGDTAIKSALGIKSLFTDLSDDNKAVLEQMRQENAAEPEGGKRLLGNVLGSLAETAVPAGKMAKALSKTKMALSAGRLAPIGAAAATSGATEFALAPSEQEGIGGRLVDKAGEAGKAAAIGGGLTGALGALAKPFRASKEAIDLMAQKIYPTLAQAADGPVGRFIGGLTSGVLPTAKRQNAEVVDEFTRRVLPGTDLKGMSTSEVAGTMDSELARQYSGLLDGKKFKLTPGARNSVWRAAQNGAGTEPDVMAEVLRRMGDVGQAVRSTNNVRLSSESLARQRSYLQDQINRVSRDPSTKAGEVKRGLVAAKGKFDETVRDPALSPDELVSLKELDGRYSDALRFMDAAEGVGAQQQMKVADLMRGYKNMDPKGGKGFATAEAPMQRDLLEPATRVMGLAPNQDEARALMVAAGRAGMKTAAGVGSTALAPAIAGPLYAASLAGQTKTGARALLGDFEMQKIIAEALRKRGGATALGAALNDQE